MTKVIASLQSKTTFTLHRMWSLHQRIHPVVPYVAPMLLMLVAVLLFPLVFSIYLSFSEITPQLRVEFSGIDNYTRIWRDSRVWRALGNSAFFTIGSVIGQFILGMTAALLLNQEIRARRWLRLAMLLPWVIPPVVGTLTWRWMFDAQYGLVNDWLLRVGLIEGFRSWTGAPDTALATTVVVNIWRGFPFMCVMLLAGLQSIPRDYYEAAAVDGAGPVQRFRYITIPALGYTIAIATTISAIWAFKEFVIVYLLTEGGPAGTSEVVVTLVYKMFFHFSRFGQAAALGVVILLILLAFTTVYVRLVAGREDET